MTLDDKHISMAGNEASTDDGSVRKNYAKLL